MKKMSIVFMGTPDYAASILEAIIKHHNLVALVCQPDKKAGRNHQIKMPKTKELLLSKGLQVPIFQPETLDNAFVKQLKSLSFDKIIVAAYGKILPKSILQLAPCVNLHASILPKYRGASPIQESILKAEDYFGITAMKMEEGLDNGDILGFKAIRNVGQNANELFLELSEAAAELTLDYLEREKEIVGFSQTHCDKILCKKIKKDFGLVAFCNAREIVRKALAYEGWPEIFLKNGVKLKGVFLHSNEGTYQQGEILVIYKEKVLVGCLKGSIWIHSLQAPSKKSISAYEYLCGKRLKVGDILC